MNRKVRKNRKMKVPRGVTSRSNTRLVTSELQAAGQITAPVSTGTDPGVGGLFVVRAADVTQWGSYANLYRQYCIKSFTVHLVPRYNSFDPNSQLFNLTTPGIGNSCDPQFCYSINKTPALTQPLSQLNVLTDNGCKINSCTRKIRIHVKNPAPDVAVSSLGITGTPYSLNTRKTMWFNTGANNQGGAASTMPHYGVSWWLRSPATLVNPLIVFDVYTSITLAFRDPA
jgi:hypothetical protein